MSHDATEQAIARNAAIRTQILDGLREPGDDSETPSHSARALAPTGLAEELASDPDDNKETIASPLSSAPHPINPPTKETL